eukprot:953-Heterococcus_DN1.PRE.5
MHTLQQANSVELVKVLLTAGASTSCTADLYDGDTPLQLAERLKFTDVAALFGKDCGAALCIAMVSLVLYMYREQWQLNMRVLLLQLVVACTCDGVVSESCKSCVEKTQHTASADTAKRANNSSMYTSQPTTAFAKYIIIIALSRPLRSPVARQDQDLACATISSAH